jgi:hypothetical protein
VTSRLVQVLVSLALLACSACSDEEDPADAEQTAGSGGATHDGSSGAGGSRAAGSGAGTAGTGSSAGMSGAAGTTGTGGTAPGFPDDLEGACDTDGDCELCTAPLSLDGDCCPGCPVVTSKEICAQLAAAFEACGPGLQLCPIPSCVAPGSPSCGAEAVCESGPGIEQ